MLITWRIRLRLFSKPLIDKRKPAWRARRHSSARSSTAIVQYKPWTWILLSVQWCSGDQAQMLPVKNLLALALDRFPRRCGASLKEAGGSVLEVSLHAG